KRGGYFATITTSSALSRERGHLLDVRVLPSFNDQTIKSADIDSYRYLLKCDSLGTFQEISMRDNKKDQLQGTLDLLVLRTLSTGGAMHGYAILDRVEQV